MASFTVAFAKQDWAQLLEGLSEPRRAHAVAVAEELSALDSGTRQARLARHFGTRRDAHAALRTLMAEVGPSLRREIFRRLPPYQRSLFPSLSAEGFPPAAPPMAALADRLIKEATR